MKCEYERSLLITTHSFLSHSCIQPILVSKCGQTAQALAEAGAPGGRMRAPLCRGREATPGTEDEWHLSLPSTACFQNHRFKEVSQYFPNHIYSKYWPETETPKRGLIPFEPVNNHTGQEPGCLCPMGERQKSVMVRRANASVPRVRLLILALPFISYVTLVNLSNFFKVQTSSAVTFRELLLSQACWSLPSSSHYYYYHNYHLLFFSP